MRGKRSRTSSDASSSSPQTVKKIIKPSVSTEDESKLSRHRTTSTTSVSSTSSSTSGNEVKSPSNKDVEKYRKACRTIQSLFDQMKALKSKNASDPKLDGLKMQCLLSFVTLKKCNRSAQIRNKQAREKTQEVVIDGFMKKSSLFLFHFIYHLNLFIFPKFTQAKQEVDSLHLQLQNLLYEITHLKKEINKCLQFK